jgi:hypothetical protein
MSDLAPFVGAALRDKVVLELQEENNKLKSENARLGRENTSLRTQQMDLVTVTGPGGHTVYACGRKDMRVEYDEPLSWHWHDPEQQIKLRDEGYTQCPVQSIANAEIHFEGRVFRLADASRTMLGSIQYNGPGTVLGYYYIFDSAPEVELILVVKFGPLPERAAELAKLHFANNDTRDLYGNPAHFQNDDIPNVKFDHLAFCANFASDSEEEE